MEKIPGSDAVCADTSKKPVLEEEETIVSPKLHYIMVLRRAGDWEIVCFICLFFLLCGGSGGRCIGRLTACLQGGIWSERLSKFWMENAVVNLSGKENGFIALDMSQTSCNPGEQG